jgi:hypothetical protein
MRLQSIILIWKILADVLLFQNMADAKRNTMINFVQNGTLPWYIQEMMGKLTTAFKKNVKNEILFIAADLGHYIADAHMPLHTSDNHDVNLQIKGNSFFMGK